MANYVRFQRGTQAAYDFLVNKGRIDENTLYFIYADESATTGTLYMGTKLISGGDVSTVPTTLEQLTDVIVTGAEANSFLIKDETGKWVAKTPAEIASLIQEHLVPSAETSTIYQAVLNENETHEQAITRILNGATPNTSDIVIIKETIADDKQKTVPYIFDGTNWIAINDKYNADDVYLDSNLVITNPDGTELSSLDTAGKSISETLNLIYKELNNTNSSLNSDNLSIEIIDGLIKLKNFGSGYYKYIPDSDPIAYQYTDGFKEGLKPRVIVNDSNELEIAWYESIDEILNTKIKDVQIRMTDLETKVGTPAAESVAASGLYAALDNKANKNDVYTKSETDTAIATAVSGADHLMRKIVNSTDEIDINAEDALRYIYMVPTGLQNDDDKYDEYVVIEYTLAEGETLRALEKVGSWEVDLTDYAKKTDLDNKANKTDVYTKTEIDEVLQQIEADSSDFISSVDSTNFKVIEGQLQLVEIASSQVTGLQDILNTGDSLITNEQKELLQKISDGEYDNYIKSVTTDFQVTPEGQLQLINVQNSALMSIVGDMTTLLDYTEGTTLVSEINNLKQALTWQNLQMTENS